MGEHLPFDQFVRQYSPVSPARADAIMALRGFAALPDDWPVVREKLKVNGGAEHVEAARDLFKYWDDTYRRRGATRMVTYERVLPAAKPRPGPREKDIITVTTSHSIKMIGPIEITVGGSPMLVPAHAVSWIKKLDDGSVIVALHSGEVIEAENTLGELRNQFTYVPPNNPARANNGNE